MEGLLPTDAMPFVWADLNAQGWGGGGDSAYYVPDQAALASVPPEAGVRIFVWDYDEPDGVVGCVAVLEHVSLGAFTGWRATPVPGSFYRGPKPDVLAMGLGV